MKLQNREELIYTILKTEKQVKDFNLTSDDRDELKTYVIYENGNWEEYGKIHKKNLMSFKATNGDIDENLSVMFDIRISSEYQYSSERKVFDTIEGLELLLSNLNER